MYPTQSHADAKVVRRLHTAFKVRQGVHIRLHVRNVENYVAIGPREIELVSSIHNEHANYLAAKYTIHVAEVELGSYL
jgi:uncharacterized protein (DUF1697 family)